MQPALPSSNTHMVLQLRKEIHDKRLYRRNITDYRRKYSMQPKQTVNLVEKTRPEQADI